MYLLIKYLLSAAIVVGVSELGKRSPGLGGLLASLPMLVAYGAMIALLRHFGIPF